MSFFPAYLSTQSVNSSCFPRSPEKSQQANIANITEPSYRNEFSDSVFRLANRWTEFKMLLTSNRFLDLRRFLLLQFPLIPQFIAHFWPICLLLFTLLYWLPVAQKWELLLKAGKGRKGGRGKKGKMAALLLPVKAPFLSENHRKRRFRASGNKIRCDFSRKISYFC